MQCQGSGQRLRNHGMSDNCETLVELLASFFSVWHALLRDWLDNSHSRWVAAPVATGLRHGQGRAVRLSVHRLQTGGMLDRQASSLAVEQQQPQTAALQLRSHFCPLPGGSWPAHGTAHTTGASQQHSAVPALVWKAGGERGML